MRRLFLIPFIFACGDSTTTQDGGLDATVDTTGDTANDGPPVDAALDCATLGDAGCKSCCTNAHPTGAATFAKAIVTCVCEPDKCFDACAPTCTTDAAASQQCATCAIQSANTKGDAGCQDQIGAACTAQPDCVAFFACSLTCP
jgi:hypothetical protein